MVSVSNELYKKEKTINFQVFKLNCHYSENAIFWHAFILLTLEN